LRKNTLYNLKYPMMWSRYRCRLIICYKANI